MIYRSNLTAPALQQNFKHLHVRPMPHSFGHDVPSDWADKAEDDPVFGLYKNCGMWTHDEAAILFDVSARLTYTFPGSLALDIGAHTGWTSIHMAAGGMRVIALEPMFAKAEFHQRFRDNVNGSATAVAQRSDEFFVRRSAGSLFRLVCVDGDHEPGKPLEDAQDSAKHLTETGVIIFHDFIGNPVREAVQWLMMEGFKCRVYFTPHVVACCWRGDFAPPDHTPDPDVRRQLLDGRMSDFDFTRCD